MDIIACIAFVPDTAAKIVPGPDGRRIDDSGVKYVISPYDEFALEEAVKLKDAHGGNITVITVSQPDRCQLALKKTLALADEAVLIDVGDEDLDPASVAELLAAQIKTMPHDAVFFGKLGVGGDHAQTFGLVSEKLGIASISVVVNLKIEADGKVRAEREIEGAREIVETSLPCAFAAQKGLNNPRSAPLKAIMKAKKKKIDVKTPADFGVDISATRRQVVVALEPPPPRPEAKILTGDPAVAAKELARLLREEAKVI